MAIDWSLLNGAVDDDGSNTVGDLVNRSWLQTRFRDPINAELSFLQAGTGAVARDFQPKLREKFSTADFGFATAASAANNATYLAAATTAAAAAGADLRIPPGTYDVLSLPNWGIEDFRVIADGQVVLHFTGTGAACTLSGGSYHTTLQGLTFKGNASCTNLLVLNGVHHTRVIDCQATDGTGAGLRITGGSVAGYVESFRCSSNEDAFATQPANGILIDNGYDITFANPIIEGVSGTGIKITSGSWHTFTGGTSEGNACGIELDGTDTAYNTFIGMDLEANTASTGRDIRISNGAQFNQFLSVTSQGPDTDAVHLVQGLMNAFIGCHLDGTTIAAASAINKFIACRTGLGGSASFADSGDRTIIDFCSNSGGTEAYRIALGRDLGTGLTPTVTAANNLTLGATSNTFVISGNTQINLIDTGAWRVSSRLYLATTGTPTIKHGQTTSGAFYKIKLKGAVDRVMAADSTMELVLYADAWYEF